MNVIKRNIGTTLILFCSGRIESTTASILENEIDEILETVTSLEINLRDVEYVSSAGLRVFLIAQKKMAKQGTMKLRGVNDIVMQVFKMTGMENLFTIEQ